MVAKAYVGQEGILWAGCEAAPTLEIVRTASAEPAHLGSELHSEMSYGRVGAARLSQSLAERWCLKSTLQTLPAELVGPQMR